ncbi:hypothetical protein Fmac_030907 [Flemingia macrophylla]|uniref:E3 ubiquitin protein ligase n=1 Tax=Flemingia macrophylla TaxID=520843 RepID=A0ABD1L0J3_9FABA
MNTLSFAPLEPTRISSSLNKNGDGYVDINIFLQCQNKSFAQQLYCHPYDYHNLIIKCKAFKIRLIAYDLNIIVVFVVYNLLDDDLISGLISLGRGVPKGKRDSPAKISKILESGCHEEEAFSYYVTRMKKIIYALKIDADVAELGLKLINVSKLNIEKHLTQGGSLLILKKNKINQLLNFFTCSHMHIMMLCHSHDRLKVNILSLIVDLSIVLLMQEPYMHALEALALRQSSTKELLKHLQDSIDGRIQGAGSIAQILHGDLSSEDAVIQMTKIDDMTKEEANNLCEVSEMNASLLEDENQLAINMTRTIGMNPPNSDAVNGSLSPENTAERNMGLRELKDSIEEAKIVDADRLSELQDAQEDNHTLTKQFQDLQNELKDDKYVRSSRIYSLANDQLQHWITELDRYKTLVESLQAGSVHVAKWENELNLKLKSADATRHLLDNSDHRIDELEIQLQKCIIEKNDLEIKLEEAKQDTGRKDIKSEFHVMASALSKEMGMMEAQLKRWKDAAHEAVSLREKTHSLRQALGMKTSELKSLANKCAEQVLEINSLKMVTEKLQKENQELEFVLDMYGQENYEKRYSEVRESESKAHSQAEMLKNALDEHSLELRVKAANEAEAACEQRLSAAEAEIEDLRAKLDISERGILELTEAVKVKDAEAEAYISEIETIGQAYEDMQTQNQNLSDQVIERDDYNIKLVSDSVKTKQTHTTLLSQKQALARQLQQINSSIENSKMRIIHSEEQMKGILSEAIKCNQEEKHLAVTLEFAKWELADAEKELKLLKSSVSSSEKEYDQIQKDMEAIETELESERSLRKKLEEELMELNNKIVELTSETGETTIQKLEKEIRICKNMIKCTVCTDRPKEVVIVKCYHLFCNPCIQRNLELRHRKCPACGTAFGQSDVRFVKI